MSKLNLLDAWKEGVKRFFAPKSAQGYMQLAMATAGAGGSACGAGVDKKEEAPAASCGAADDGEKKEEKPAACGASCGASDKK
jgi:ACGX-repeat protein